MTIEFGTSDRQAESAVVEFLSNFVNVESAVIRAMNAGMYQVSRTKNHQGQVIFSTVTIRTRTGWIMTLTISNGSVENVTMQKIERPKRESQQ